MRTRQSRLRQRSCAEPAPVSVEHTLPGAGVYLDVAVLLA